MLQVRKFPESTKIISKVRKFFGSTIILNSKIMERKIRRKRFSEEIGILEKGKIVRREFISAETKEELLKLKEEFLKSEEI